MNLLKSQKSQIYGAAVTMGFDPSRFEWATRESEFISRKIVECLNIKGTPYYFAFDSSETSRVCVYAPGREKMFASLRAKDWPGVLNRFVTWVQNAQRELDAPDPWKQLQDQSVTFDFGLDDSTADRPFSVAENAKVAQTLSVIQSLLITYANETNAKQETILIGIKKLEKAAESMDRKSWFQQAVGYIVNTATAMGLDPEKTRALFTALKNGLEGTLKFLVGPS